MDPNKPRIQLKINPSTEGKETSLRVQGTSASTAGQGKKEQAKATAKTKRKVTSEDTSASEKRPKITEESPPRMPSTADGGDQVIVAIVGSEDGAHRTKTSAELSKGTPLFVSKTEWFEATKSLHHLVRIYYHRSSAYKVRCSVFSMLTALRQVAQATGRATKELGQKLEEARRATEGLKQELEETKSELRLKEEQARLAVEEAQAKLTEAHSKLNVLEEEVGKLRETSQGDLARVVVQKVLGSKTFTNFSSQLGQLSSREAHSNLLNQLAEDNGLALRKKEYGWNPHSEKVTKKAYAQLVLEKPPVFPILEYLSKLTDMVSAKDIEQWKEDDDLPLAEDLKLEIPADYEDLDPSSRTKATRGRGARKGKENFRGYPRPPTPRGDQLAYRIRGPRCTNCGEYPRILRERGGRS